MTQQDFATALRALTQQALDAGITATDVCTALDDEAAGVTNDADPQ